MLLFLAASSFNAIEAQIDFMGFWNELADEDLIPEYVDKDYARKQVLMYQEDFDQNPISSISKLKYVFYHRKKTHLDFHPRALAISSEFWETATDSMKRKPPKEVKHPDSIQLEKHIQLTETVLEKIYRFGYIKKPIYKKLKTAISDGTITHPYYLFYGAALILSEEQLTSKESLLGFLKDNQAVFESASSYEKIVKKVENGKADLEDIYQSFGGYFPVKNESVSSLEQIPTVVEKMLKEVFDNSITVEMRDTNYLRWRKDKMLKIRNNHTTFPFTLRYTPDEGPGFPEKGFKMSYYFTQSYLFKTLIDQLAVDKGFNDGAYFVDFYQILNNRVKDLYFRDEGFDPYFSGLIQTKFRGIKKKVIIEKLDKELRFSRRHSPIGPIFKSEKRKHITTLEKNKYLDLFKEMGFYDRKTEKEMNQIRIDVFHFTHFFLPSFFDKAEVVYWNDEECQFYSYRSPKDKKQYEVVLENFDKKCRQNLNIKNYNATLREGGRSFDFQFELAGKSFQYILVPNSDYHSEGHGPCAQLIKMVATSLKKTNLKERLYYQEGCCGIFNNNPGYVFSLTDNEVKIFEETFAINLIEYPTIK